MLRETGIVLRLGGGATIIVERSIRVCLGVSGMSGLIYPVEAGVAGQLSFKVGDLGAGDPKLLVGGSGENDPLARCEGRSVARGQRQDHSRGHGRGQGRCGAEE